MNKGKIARLAGFVGALGISAALVAGAVSGTGAYFTSTQGGNLQGSSGHLQITSTGTNINFSGLNPGDDKQQNVTYTVTQNTTTKVDIWLKFDTSSAAYGAFTGANGTTYGAFTGGGLGGFGHFKVVSDEGYSFESYNLQLPTAASAIGGYTNGNCVVAANGTGGSTAKATGPDNGSQAAPECGVPGYIQLAANLVPGQTAYSTLTFGLTGKATGQDTTFVNVPFTVVATQAGILPNAGNF